MSEHLVPIPADGNVTEGIAGLSDVIRRLIRAPERIELRGSDVAYIFEPDLSAQDAARFAELVATARSRIRFEPEEMDALRSDIDGLRTYHGLATPTAAQTAQATKAIIRVLRAILRD